VVKLANIWRCPKKEKIKHIKSVGNQRWIIAAERHLHLVSVNAEEIITNLASIDYQSGSIYASV
jgi:hypothetical protein